jgi:hypothetical protein
MEIDPGILYLFFVSFPLVIIKTVGNSRESPRYRERVQQGDQRIAALEERINHIKAMILSRRGS